MSDRILGAPLAGWAMRLADVPDAVFAGGMMGSGGAIDPTEGTLHAPCDAVVASVHAARHAVALTCDDGAELLLHIGIDSVAMGGAGFAALVAAGDRVVAGQPLIRFDLDTLVLGATAAATPVLSVADGFVAEPIALDRLVRVGEPFLRLFAVAARVIGPADGDTTSRAVTVALPHGIHARPAARIAAAVRALDASVTLVRGEVRASALSVTALLGVGGTRGAALAIEASGRDAAAAIDAVAAILTATVDPDAAPAAARRNDGAGVGAVPGLAIGTARWLRLPELLPPPGSGDAGVERAALDTGLARLRSELEHAGGVMAAHRALLDDPELLAALAAAAPHGAAAAAITVTRAQAATLAATGDARIAERGDDLRDIGQRLAHAILGTVPDPIVLSPDTILLADDLLPSQFAALGDALPAGIAIARGGPTSHVAIMAAARGVPTVVALGDRLAGIADGATVLLDGTAGTLVADPDPSTLARAEARIADDRAAAEAARTIVGPGRTRDGHAVAVHVNLGSASEAAAAVADGAEGCGLLRTELLFLDRTTPPARDEQAAAYRAALAALAGRPLTIRLLDVGGDKPAPYLAIAPEENPALGLRGVRTLFAHPDLLEAQVAAILDASHAGPCRIMVPMVAGVDEMAAVRAVVDRLRGERDVAVGAMIETPAAAVSADIIAAACDFVSIGTNDLTQYALAMDRGNAAVAAGIDGLHPAVLRLIAATCEGAASAPIPVGVCGGLAADPLAVPILIGLGVTSLSVPPARIAATRALVSALSYEAACRHAQHALRCASAAAVRDLARAFAEEHRA